MSAEKDRIRQIALEKLEARMCGDRDFSRVPTVIFPGSIGDDVLLDKAIRYFPKFLYNALRRIFQFPEAVSGIISSVVKFKFDGKDKQNMVDSFNNECTFCILLVNSILESLLLHNPQEELDFLEKYESFCEKAKKQLKDELATMEQNEQMSLSLIHRALKLKKERKALAEQLQTFVGRVIGRIIRDIERKQKIEPQGKGGQSKTDIPDYMALNLAKRTIKVRATPYNITSEKVWDFLKDLCSAHRDDRLVPRFEGERDNKNNVDQLRKQIGKDNLHKLILFVAGGYKLDPDVKILAGGQIGIRKTHLSRNRK